jgi:glyoxylase-like metal-dependent hydrolase (beta-lactamase superfamily II)
VIVRQFLHTDPTVAASYLIGCGGAAVGAVVDPVADPELYVQAARETQLTIRYVIDTHVHADHVSSGRELAEQVGGAYVLHECAGATVPFQRVSDGQHLVLGNVDAEILHTPGHTPEHLSLLVTDRTRGPDPWLVLTGHTLLIGDMGRTELASTLEAGAQALFESAERLRALPDYVEVLPGAFAGSVCGRALSGTPMSTIGFERRFNTTFRITDRSEFVARMARDIPPAPPDAASIRARNMGTL